MSCAFNVWWSLIPVFSCKVLRDPNPIPILILLALSIIQVVHALAYCTFMILKSCTKLLGLPSRGSQKHYDLLPPRLWGVSLILASCSFFQNCQVQVCCIKLSFFWKNITNIIKASARSWKVLYFLEGNRIQGIQSEKHYILPQHSTYICTCMSW